MTLSNTQTSKLVGIDDVPDLLRGFLLSIPSITNQYEMRAFFKASPGLQEFVEDTIVYYPRLSAKLFSLLGGGRCGQCGQPTQFYSITKGFSSHCELHKSFSSVASRISNKLSEVETKLQEQNLQVVVRPDSINSGRFILKCDVGHEFEMWLKNGRISKSVVCPICFPKTVSQPERDITTIIPFGVIQQYPILKQGRGVTKLDVFVPIANLAIEYNGVMFHSFGKSEHSMFDNANEEDKNKHHTKTQLCDQRGIQLFHIFGNEWEQKRQIWESKIRLKCGVVKTRIFARKCRVVDVSSKEAKAFQERTHLQGSANGSIRFGLEFEGRIVSVMTFCKARLTRGDYELLRFSSELDTIIVGGASKLLKHFERLYPNTIIISYANLRWSVGDLYRSLGFEEINRSSPNYFYFKPNGSDDVVLESRQKFQRHKLDDSKSGSESEIMFDRGFRRIWDCGNIVFRKQSPPINTPT